jgi:hypothetical protein
VDVELGLAGGRTCWRQVLMDKKAPLHLGVFDLVFLLRAL